MTLGYRHIIYAREMTMSPDSSVLWLDADTRLPSLAGGKARGLQLILRMGLPIPPTWVVLAGCSKGALHELALDLERRGLHAVAVRSSAEGEDDSEASFAGIHESILGVPPAQLASAVRSVSDSALSPRAAEYRQALGLAPAPGPCSVVVQGLVSACAGGVAFGSAAADQHRVTIEAVQGLGTLAADGSVTPARITVTNQGGSWQVESRRASSQAQAQAGCSAPGSCLAAPDPLGS